MTARRATCLDGRPCPVTGLDVLTCEAGCRLLQGEPARSLSSRRSSGSAPTKRKRAARRSGSAPEYNPQPPRRDLISVVSAQDPTIPAPRLAPPPSRWRLALEEIGDVVRDGGWRGSLLDLALLLAAMGALWALALILHAAGVR